MTRILAGVREGRIPAGPKIHASEALGSAGRAESPEVAPRTTSPPENAVTGLYERETIIKMVLTLRVDVSAASLARLAPAATAASA